MHRNLSSTIYLKCYLSTTNGYSCGSVSIYAFCICPICVLLANVLWPFLFHVTNFQSKNVFSSFPSLPKTIFYNLQQSPQSIMIYYFIYVCKERNFGVPTQSLYISMYRIYFQCVFMAELKSLYINEAYTTAKQACRRGYD